MDVKGSSTNKETVCRRKPLKLQQYVIGTQKQVVYLCGSPAVGVNAPFWGVMHHMPIYHSKTALLPARGNANSKQGTEGARWMTSVYSSYITID